MLRGMRFQEFILLLVTSLVLTSCYSFTGVPAHGGGKRFYEEQKLVASSVQKACDQIKTQPLKGKKVTIKLVSMETSGGAQITMPNNAFSSMRLDYGFTNTLNNVTEFASDLAQVNSDPNLSSNRERSSEEQNVRLLRPEGELQLNTNPIYRPFFNRSSEDVNYLRKAVEMKMQMEGVELVSSSEADVTLNILVNALGTKNATLSSPFKINESLEASCDLTYYAVENKSKDLLISKNRATSIARYDVDRVRFSSKLREGYSTPKSNDGVLFD